MANQVVAGALMQCSFGMTPAPLAVLPQNQVMAGGPIPAANIFDMKPLLNVPPFGMCSAPSNPVVAAATAAALGVLTPMPCIPVPAGTWLPGDPSVLIGFLPALTNDCKLMCAWGGIIQINVPGEFVVTDG
jgi:hypothetical protein